jgi:hypothetical protein
VTEKARLEAIATMAHTKLQVKDYDAARAALKDLHWNYQEAACKSDAVQQEKTTWDSRRAEISALIVQAEEAIRAGQRDQARREEEAQRAIVEREAHEKQVAAERANERRISAAENDLTEKIRQRTAARRANGND